MTQGRTPTIRCWTDGLSESNVVTIEGVTPEEARHILRYASERTPEALLHKNGQTVLTLTDANVMIRHYHQAGGEVELMSHGLSHDGLLAFIPETLRTRSGL